jgi:RHS repeat-associated protein
MYTSTGTYEKFSFFERGGLSKGSAVFKILPDCTPYGTLLDGRHGQQNGTDYRYGFQGQEADDEVSGEGNSYTAEFWQYSSRIGRRWNIDPVLKGYESPYACFANNPIWFVDLNGADTSFNSNESRLQFNDMMEETCTLIDQEVDALTNAQSQLANAKSKSDIRSAKKDVVLHTWRLATLHDLNDGLTELINSPIVINFEGHPKEFFPPGIFGEFMFIKGQGITVQFTNGRNSTIAHEAYHGIQYLRFKTSIGQMPGVAYDLVDEYEARLISIIFDPEDEMAAIMQNNPMIYEDIRDYVMPMLKKYYTNRGISDRPNQIVLTSDDIKKLSQQNYENGSIGAGPIQLYPGWEVDFFNGLLNHYKDDPEKGKEQLEKAKKYYFGDNN